MIYFNIIICVVCIVIITALIIESVRKQNKYKEKIEKEEFDVCIGNNNDPGWSKEKMKEIENFVKENAKKRRNKL